MTSLHSASRQSGVRMSIHSLLQRASRGLMALSLGLGLGLLALHTGCAKNDNSYEHPGPAVSSFQVSLTKSFSTDPTKQKTAESVPVGGSVWCLANFGTKDGSATVTPGNIPVTSNVPFQITNITASTTYTLTVTSGDGQKTTATISVTVLTAPSGLAYANEDATYYMDVQIPINGPTSVVGSTPIDYGVGPALPAGLSMDPATGIISGVPQVSAAQATYTVTAHNQVGSTTHTIKIAVAPTPLTFTLAPAIINPGGSATLTWDATSIVGLFSAVNLTAVPADATLTGPFGLSGTKNVSPVVTTTYTLTATPTTGGPAVTRTVDLTVGSVPVTITSLSYTPTTILYGGSTTLSWSYTGLADKLTLNGANVLGTTTADATPIRRQSFTLFGSNSLGEDTRTLKIPSKGLHHVAGSFSSGTGNVDGGADPFNDFSTARFYRPNAISWDEKANDGTMIVADYTNNLVRRITPDRKVATIAGTPGLAGAAGTNTDTTTLITPRNTAVDPVTGDIYVGGENYTTKRLLKLSPNGDGTYTPSLVPGFTYNTNAFAIDASRKMYFVDFATTAASLYTMDLTSATPSPVLVANLTTNGVVAATAMAKDFNGGRNLLYVACSTTGVNKIMKIDVSGATPVVSLFAGTGAQGYADNAVATSGLLNGPSGVCADDSGNVYIADSFNMAIR